MLRIFSLDSGRMVCTTVDGPPRTDHELPSALWYELLQPTAEERAFVNANAHVEVPARDDMEAIEVSSRLYSEDGGEYMTITAVTGFDAPEGPRKTPVMFILKGETLITVRYDRIRPFENVVDRATRNGGVGQKGEPIMLSLVEALVDRLADALEQIGDSVDALSRGVFGSKVGSSAAHRDLEETVQRVGLLGDRLGLVRESLVSFTRLIGFHQGSDAVPVSPDAKGRIKTIQRDVAALADHASYLGSKLAFVLDATLGLINLEQSQIIKIFSIAAVCLMPPTLIASVYGMNFKHMPELDWPFGYPMALGAMLIAAIAPYLYFKKLGWL